MGWPLYWCDSLRSAKPLRDLADFQTIHLEFQRAEGDAEIAGRRRDVPSRFFQRPQDEIALECVGGLLEQAFPVRGDAIELGELTRLIAAQQPAIAMEAGSALFMNFRELLTTLIGAPLTERLLQAAWSTPSSAPLAQDPKP